MLIVRNRDVVVEVVRLVAVAAAVLVMTAVVVTRSESALSDPVLPVAVDDRPPLVGVVDPVAVQSSDRSAPGPHGS